MKDLEKMKFIFWFLIFVPSFVSAETHFDLNAQLFSETKTVDKMIGARYELPKSFVTTNLNYVGYYKTLNDYGHFNVELKQPIVSWGVSLDAFYGYDGYASDLRSIRLTAENGASIIISIQYSNVMVNGVKVYAPTLERQRMSFAINKSADSLSINIDGRLADTISLASFDKLKFVELQLIQEHYSSSSYTSDQLHGLTISGE